MGIIKQFRKNKGVPVQYLCKSVGFSRASYYRRKLPGTTKPFKDIVKKSPKNSLTIEEKEKILEIFHAECFVDKTPYEIFNAFIGKEEYYCSTRTMHRLLEENGGNQERRKQRSHREAIRPEWIATRPNQVEPWNITKLRGPGKFEYYYLYSVIDIYSRYTVGWLIAECESQELACKLIEKTAEKQGVQPGSLTLHSDRGPSMTSHSVKQLLSNLGIMRTHSRPYTSNDNPFSESQFKTLKYCPDFPGQFSSLKETERFYQSFFGWYNTSHYHSGIAWLTPEMVHYGRAEMVLEKRHAVRIQAFLKYPIRFKNRPPIKQKNLQAVYINPPQPIVNFEKRVDEERSWPSRSTRDGAGKARQQAANAVR